ncbi:MAG: restriction endonuclease, partial [Clostridia bacterium]|nr:restriction endonuclease [Clostridia bacterium]
FRFLLFFGKGTMQVTRSVFGLIPLQDFSKTWTDEELYKKYNLTQEEIDFIESMIKPMDDN